MEKYKDPSAPIEERVSDLLSRMTLEEKFGQMRMLAISKEEMQAKEFDLSILEKNLDRCGGFYDNQSMPAETLNRIQKWYKENTRLGIPIAPHGESLHGAKSKYAVVFPQAEGLASMFSRERMAEVVSEIGREARANGFSMTYAPNLDLSRDARWGRVEENYGEDPYLTGELGTIYIKELQAQKVAACPKHYIAHGSPESGINIAPVHAGPREFRETMMKPFRKAIREGKPYGIMPAYSELDGVPMHASREMLTDLLRGEFGFEGAVISDYGAVTMLHTLHHVADSPLEAGKLALNAGVDVEANNVFGYGPELLEAVRRGDVPEERINTAVSRILYHKFAIGLFDDPFVDPQKQKSNRSPEAIALTKKAAQESIVLLKNENALLPLDSFIGRVALVGPNADDPQLGDYTASEAAKYTVTLRTALEKRLGADRVIYARGCGIASGTPEMEAEAIEAARNADIVIAVMGDNSNFYGGVGWGIPDSDGKIAVTCGEGFDVSSLDLPGKQESFLENLYALGKPIVLILETGRPYSICWAKEHIPAILQAWYPGEQGGNALADILLGDVSPSGRLPISFPRSAGHIPCFYNTKLSSRGVYQVRGTPEKPGRDYVFSSPDALFPFGYGLSYTQFSYSDISVTPKTGVPHSTPIVSVTVTNSGTRASYEVVQLYISDLYCRITPFVKQLRGFEKIWLEPGESKNVSFRLSEEDFSFVNENLKEEVEPGEFKIMVGNLDTAYFIKAQNE